MYDWEHEILALYATGYSADMGCGRAKIGTFGIDLATQAADLKCDMANVPLAAQTFDSIVSSHALEHAPDTPKVLREWFRLLKPRGTVALFTPDWNQVSAKDLGDTTGDHRQLYTRTTLPKFFSNAGFVVVDCARLGRALFLVARKPK